MEIAATPTRSSWLTTDGLKRSSVIGSANYNDFLRAVAVQLSPRRVCLCLLMRCKVLLLRCGRLVLRRHLKLSPYFNVDRAGRTEHGQNRNRTVNILIR